MSAPRLSAVLCSIILALLLSLPATAQSSQHALTIHVTDPAGAPVAGARVAATLRDDRVFVPRVSDTAGHARFDTLSPGTYVVHVDAAGFAPAARTIAVQPDTSRITISLNLAAVIEHVVVTGAGHLQTASEVSKAVSVVDAGEITVRNECFRRRRAAHRAGSHRSDALSSVNESPGAIGPLPTTGFVQAGSATFVPSANDPDSVRASDFVSTLVLFEQRPSSAFGYTVSLHRLGTDRMFRDGPLGVSAFEPVTQTSSRFRGTVDTLDVRADREWSTRQVTRFAYEFERERYVSESLPVNLGLAWNADITQHAHAASVHHEVRFDALQVVGGLRAQRFALKDVTLAPAERAPFAAASFASPPSALTADVAATRLFARTGTKLRAHAGNAYRAPAMFERAGVSFGNRGYSVFGDPGIEPERSISVDAGLDQALSSGRALLSATWFHTRLTRVIAFQSLDRATDPFGRSSGYRGGDGRSARGVELSARLHPHRALQASVAYTFADAPPPAGDRDGLPRAAAVSAHQFAALVTYILGPLQLSFELEASGDHYVTLFDPVSFGARAYRFAGVTKGDLAGGYRLPIRRASIRLFGTVENAFNRDYFVQGFETAGRTARGGLTVAL